MPQLVLFDFDGVILESAELKGGVFAELFSDMPQHIPAILDLHERLGGISRIVKFDLIYRDILKQPLDDETRNSLADQFAERAFKRVLECPEVSGAKPFLEYLKSFTRSVVVSGTPDEELKEIVKRRGFDPDFAEVHGSPREKPEIVTDVLTRHGVEPQKALFIGDAMTDYDAAQQCGVPFLGRVRPGNNNPFPEETVTAADFKGMDRRFEMIYKNTQALLSGSRA